MKIYTTISLQDSIEDIHNSEDSEIIEYIAATQEILKRIKSMQKDKGIIKITDTDFKKYTEAKRLRISITRKEYRKFLESLKSISEIKREKRYKSEFINIDRRKNGDLFLITLYNDLASKAQEVLKP